MRAKLFQERNKKMEQPLVSGLKRKNMDDPHESPLNKEKARRYEERF